MRAHREATITTAACYDDEKDLSPFALLSTTKASSHPQRFVFSLFCMCVCMNVCVCSHSLKIENKNEQRNGRKSKKSKSLWP